MEEEEVAALLKRDLKESMTILEVVVVEEEMIQQQLV